jgi:pSer/pThr/pTyr-binding forkhead associated (FHA) protein
MVAILHPTGPGMQIPIDRAVVLIGRSPECDVVLDVSSKISRMHCALVQVDTAYYIRDLGSLNGVTVAGERVEKDVKLTNGTEVQIGDVRFLFLENVLPAAELRKPHQQKGIQSSLMKQLRFWMLMKWKLSNLLPHDDQ